MLPTIPLAWKIAGGLGLVLALIVGAGVIYEKGVAAGEANVKAAVAEATAKLEAQATSLSNELVIQEAIASTATAKKETAIVQQIRQAPTADAKFRAGSYGVHTIILGEAGGAERSPDAAVPRPGADGRPGKP